MSRIEFLVSQGTEGYISYTHVAELQRKKLFNIQNNLNDQVDQKPINTEILCTKGSLNSMWLYV